MKESLKIIFMGTPDFALSALQQIHEYSGHDVAAVYSQPPRPRGRGHKLQPTPVDEYASRHGIPVYTPKSLKQPEAQKEFAALNADVAVVAAYGLLLPPAILEAPAYGCLNIHASLLPRWRGASPIQQAILHGDEQTGVTIMQMDAGLDTGPMSAKESVPITAQTTAAGLHDELAALGGDMIVQVLDEMAAAKSRLPAEPQNEAEATYAPLLSKQDGRIDWTQTAQQIDRQIRALNPWPGVWTELEGKRFKILQAFPNLPPPAGGREEDAGASEGGGGIPGTLLDRKGHIVCGQNSVLRLSRIQPPGAKPMDFSAAVNGGYIQIQG